jgi:GNAT superfamily N-acetyltransferase
MQDTKALFRTTLEAGKDMMRSPVNRPHVEPSSKPAPLMVPIRSLGDNQRGRILDHLCSLDSNDRYLRFGYSATDEQIQRYVDSLDFERDDIFGIYNRKLQMVAMGHLAYSGEGATRQQCDSCAEFGVSVQKSSRGRGYGSRLFGRAAMHARNEGVNLLFIHALSQNDVMLKIARDAGAVVTRDGSESEAYLQLMPATVDSRVTELLQEQIAVADYHIKAQAKQFWEFLALIQAVRSDAINGSESASS